MDDDSMRSVRWLVHGGVQGVGFRWATRRRAVALGLTGFVRNLDDGTVEVLAQGPAHATGALADWLRHGPPGAAVERIDESAAEPISASTFQIAR